MPRFLLLSLVTLYISFSSLCFLFLSIPTRRRQRERASARAYVWSDRIRNYSRERLFHRLASDPPRRDRRDFFTCAQQTKVPLGYNEAEVPWEKKLIDFSAENASDRIVHADRRSTVRAQPSRVPPFSLRFFISRFSVRIVRERRAAGAQGRFDWFVPVRRS